MMLSKLTNWFRRNAYGKFATRIALALGAAAVSVAISFLPYETVLQATWVIISSLLGGVVVLRQRLNESDDDRYRRLFHSLFRYLENNDPEALTTIFAENLRPRVLGWFASEHGIAIAEAPKIDALDSLAHSGDGPGQLIFRTGVKLGRWLQTAESADNKLTHLNAELDRFIVDQESLLGIEIADGVFIRHIRQGEHRPTGIHMFHPRSRLLLTIEHYQDREWGLGLALSARSFLFEGPHAVNWNNFRSKVHQQFACFIPANGGSGPQKQAIPFFVGTVTGPGLEQDEMLIDKLKPIIALLPERLQEPSPGPRP